MPSKKSRQPADIKPEEKIKKAARIVFHKKGFAATRTRDIAKEANINLALLNYYFRSKQKLFELVMLETAVAFLQKMQTVFNDEATSLEEKVQQVTENYIDLLIAEPEVPLFIMSEIRSHGAEILEKLPVANSILQSVFIKQFGEAAANGKIVETNPLHFIMNLMGLIVFPFISSPMLKKIGKLKEKQFEKLMQERKKLLPLWINAMLKAK